MKDYFSVHFFVRDKLDESQTRKIIREDKNVIINSYEDFKQIPMEKYLAFEYSQGTEVYLHYDYDNLTCQVKSSSTKKIKTIENFIEASLIKDNLELLNKQVILKCMYSFDDNDMYVYSMLFIEEMYSPCVYEMLNVVSELSLSISPFLYKEFYLDGSFFLYEKLKSFTNENSLMNPSRKIKGIFLVPVDSSFDIRKNYIILG